MVKGGCFCVFVKVYSCEHMSAAEVCSPLRLIIHKKYFFQRSTYLIKWVNPFFYERQQGEVYTLRGSSPLLVAAVI